MAGATKGASKRGILTLNGLSRQKYSAAIFIASHLYVLGLYFSTGYILLIASNVIFVLSSLCRARTLLTPKIGYICSMSFIFGANIFGITLMNLHNLRGTAIASVAAVCSLWALGVSMLLALYMIATKGRGSTPPPAP